MKPPTERPTPPSRPAYTRRLSDQMGERSLLRPKTTTWATFKHKLHFLLEMIVGIDLLAVLLASSALTLWVYWLDRGNAWLSFLSESKAAISTLGAFYSFALVFRTNICYARWWEGRTLWGTMIVYSVRVAQQSRLWIDDDALVERLHCMAIAFPYVCKAQLRGNSIKDNEEDGLNLVLKGVLSKQELDMMAHSNAWQPYFCIDVMRAAIDEGFKMNRNAADWSKVAALQAMEDTICTLATSVGGCIRVRSTGLPEAYDDILYTMGGFFFVSACAAWAPGAGLYNPIVVLVVYVVAKMIVGVGNDMEDPFGHDESDLPLEKFCATIEEQINAIDIRAETIAYNLAYGPPSEHTNSNSTITSTVTRTPSPGSDSMETDPLLFKL